ncbi:MAG: hypothetical protein AAGA75_17495 [Cyanobacteria bacterium P01_E01_bin.6]
MLKPHRIIGRANAPYLLRWYLIPRNPWFNIYLHKFLRSDNDVPHDHPWNSVSVALWGKAIEQIFIEDAIDVKVKYIRAGDIVGRSALHRHQMIIFKPFWTLFITGPVTREWGFWCGDRRDRFVPWKAFTVEKDGVSEVGKGCGE